MGFLQMKELTVAVGVCMLFLVLLRQRSSSTVSRPNVDRNTIFLQNRNNNNQSAKQKNRSRSKWGVVQIFDIRDGSNNDDYAHSILSTNQGLRDTGMIPRVDHVVYVVQDSVKDEQAGRKAFGKDIQTSLALFQACGIKMVTVADVINVSVTKNVEQMQQHFVNADRFNSYFYKLTIFNMVMYDKLLWLDNDVVVLQSFLSLFQRAEAIDAVRSFEVKPDQPLLPALYAVGDIGSGMCYNSGMMMFSPRLSDFNGIMDLLRTPVLTKFTKPEEDTPENRLDAIKEAVLTQIKREQKNHIPDVTKNTRFGFGETEQWVSSCTGEPRTDGDQEIIIFYFLTQRRLEALPPYYNALVSHHSGSFDSPTDWATHMPTAGNFLMWAFHSAGSRAQLKLVHIGWPKPSWPMWNPKEALSDEMRSDPRVHTKWLSKPKWFVMFAVHGEAAMSFLALFKTFWARIQKRMISVCNEFKSAPVTQFNVRVQQTDGTYTNREVKLNVGKWCADRNSYFFLGDGLRHLNEGPNSLLVDSSIPTWAETIEAATSS